MDNLIAKHVAEVLKAIAHPVRLQIIEVLETGRHSVGEIIEKTGHPQSVISQQLGLMKDKGVLECCREGTKAFYSIRNTNVVKLLHCINDHCDRNSIQIQ
jgi:ArsR family transcriptional regulator